MSTIKHIDVIQSSVLNVLNPFNVNLILVWEKPDLMLKLQKLGSALAVLKLALLGFQQVCLCVQTAVNLPEPLNELGPPHAALF